MYPASVEWSPPTVLQWYREIYKTIPVQREALKWNDNILYFMASAHVHNETFGPDENEKQINVWIN